MRVIGLAVVLVLCLVVNGRALEVERRTFGDWTARCETDKMTDAKKCLVLSKPVAFGFLDGRLQIVLVGTKHYPGSQVMLRIDSEPPLSTKEPGFTGKQADEILNRFTGNADRIRTRYREWPGRFVDSELSTRGVADALAYVRSLSGALLPPADLVQPAPPANDRTQVVTLPEFPYAYYARQVAEKIRAQWNGKAIPGQQPAVIFEIRRDGRLNQVTIDKSSGNASYDEVALRAINDAGPFPPLPEEFKEAVLRIKLQLEFDPKGG
jgi:TonB family protein